MGGREARDGAGQPSQASDMIRVIDRVGITVPDLEAAPAFLVGAFDGRGLHRLSPLVAGDVWMLRRLGVDARPRAPEIAVLDRGGHCALPEIVPVMERFRTGFASRVSGVLLFWGSLT